MFSVNYLWVVELLFKTHWKQYIIMLQYFARILHFVDLVNDHSSEIKRWQHLGENPTNTHIPVCKFPYEIATCEKPALFVEQRECFSCHLLHPCVTFLQPVRNHPLFTEHSGTICAYSGKYRPLHIGFPLVIVR